MRSVVKETSDLLGEGGIEPPEFVFMRTSFEDRSIALIKVLEKPHSELLKVTNFATINRTGKSITHLEEMKRHFGDKLQTKKLYLNHPTDTFDKLREVVGEFVSEASGKSAIIDISSFRREELLMLLYLFWNHYRNGTERATDEAFNKWHLVYSLATPNKWLSGRPLSVRNVIGYMGEMRPSRRTALVILSGFEVARAVGIYEKLEPNRVAVGRSSTETVPGAKETANEQLGSLVRHLSIDEQKDSFKFDTRDPGDTARALKEHIEEHLSPSAKNEGYNVVIAPLNSKISTIGAGLYGLVNKEVQICYAPVEAYYDKDYSKWGGKWFWMKITDLWGVVDDLSDQSAK